MNPTNASQQSSRTHLTPSSSLRPRNKRLISGIDDEAGSNGLAGESIQSSRNGSPTGSPYQSRAVSPIPSVGPSRSTSKNPGARALDTTVGNRSSTPADDALSPLTNLWNNSWTSLQGLASNVLGSDTSASREGSPARRRRPFEATHNRKATSSAPPAQWGPSGREEAQIGVGSKEERENMVRAMKRKDLLNANGDLQADSLGRFKRRMSDERISTSAPPTEHDDRDALVYIHRVKPDDTLAGITIKYSCNQAVLRKANRMWAQDSVQTRRHLVLPVDACAVKGRPVPAPEELKQKPVPEDDLLASTPGSEYPPIHSNSLPNTNGWHHSGFNSTISLKARPSASDTDHKDNEPPWKHDSWVLLPHSKDPVEIARLPRRDLGFFPPARRKSLTFSDDVPSASSTANTSLDLNRTDTYTSQSSSATTTTGGPKSPQNSLPTRGSGSRPRRTSVSQSFKLDGPGGVGTFNRNVRKPGPAQDGLNKLFPELLPSLKPPPGKDYFGTWNPAQMAESGNGDALGMSGTATPVGVGGVGGSSAGAGASFDLENVGGAIEAWMRKMASRASTLVPSPGPGTPAARSRSAAGRANLRNTIGAPPVGLNAAVGGNVTDLIELTDAFEIGSDEEDRGRTGPGGVVGTGARVRSQTGSVRRKGGKGD